MKGKFMKKEKGITLIALVITIIVLLILAGVAISMLSGENGILTRAVEAKEKTEIAQKEETTNLESMDLETYFITNNSKYKCANGYITGIGVEGTEVTDTVEDLQKALPEGYSVSGENITTGTKLYTGLSVTKDSQEVAKVVVYGDCDGSGELDVDDIMTIAKVLKPYKNVNVILQSMDVNHDSIINKDDRILIEKYNNDAEGYGVDINQNVYAKRTEDLKIVYDFEYNQNIIDNELPKEFRDSYNIYYNTEKKKHVLKLESNQEVKAIEILNKLGEKYNNSTIILKQEGGDSKSIYIGDTDAEDIVKNEDVVIIQDNEDIEIMRIYIEV